MNVTRCFLLAGLVALSGCTNEGLAYANKHTELSPVQRQILSTGKVPPGDAVAGLTHDQVKVAMKGFPATFDKINGEEAWIYVRKKSLPVGMAVEAQASPSQRRDMPDATYAGPIYDVNERTTIFFTGDRATHATVAEDKP